jgi:hypothetical protein
VLVLVVAVGVFRAMGGGTPSSPSEPRVTPDAAVLAEDTAARASLHEARSAAAAVLTEGGSLEGVGPSQLELYAPDLTFVDGGTPSSGPTVVSVASDATAIGLAVLSQSGTCFLEHQSLSAGTSTGTASGCTGEAALQPGG